MKWPTAEIIYVLGTSDDINSLDTGFFKDNLTIGINQTMPVVEKTGEQLTYWVCVDAFKQFYEFLVRDTSPDTIKLVVDEYADTTLLANLAGLVRNKDSVRTYMHVYDIGVSCCLEPVILGCQRFSILCAIALAAGLRPREIRLRGVSLGGGYCNTERGPNANEYYDEIANHLRGLQPFLAEDGIKLINDTENTDFLK